MPANRDLYQGKLPHFRTFPLKMAPPTIILIVPSISFKQYSLHLFFKSACRDRCEATLASPWALAYSLDVQDVECVLQHTKWWSLCVIFPFSQLSE